MTEVRAKKALGQHFLVDLNIARKICNSLSGGKDAGGATQTAVRSGGGAGADATLPGGRVVENTIRPDGVAGNAASPDGVVVDNVARPDHAAADDAVLSESVVSNAASPDGVVVDNVARSDHAAADDAVLSESVVSNAASPDGVVVDNVARPDHVAADVVALSRDNAADDAVLSGRAAADDVAFTGNRAAETSVESGLGASRVSEPCDVLEVGCGMGVLTQFLLKRTDIVTWGAEIDSESVEYLHAHYPEFAPRLIEGDFLKMDLRTAFPRGVRIIGNFPYNISSQIFFKVLEYRDLVPECVGMIQKEVAVRLAEPPGSKEYGILSVLLQAWYNIEYLFTVNETVFNPPPKVKSAVIRLRRNGVERLACDEELFVRVVKASFGQRRKMLRNALKAAFGDFGGAEHAFFTQRAEQLGVADFVELTAWVAANRK